jgi:hypothetical protein
MEWTGGCLCGAMRFRAQGEPLDVASCHCVNCRKMSGAAFATFVVFAPDSSRGFKANSRPTPPRPISCAASVGTAAARWRRGGTASATNGSSHGRERRTKPRGYGRAITSSPRTSCPGCILRTACRATSYSQRRCRSPSGSTGRRATISSSRIGERRPMSLRRLFTQPDSRAAARVWPATGTA